MNPIIAARVEVVRTALQMRQLGIHLLNHQEKMDVRTQIFIGAAMVAIGKHAFTAMTIIDKPNEILPPAGRRCIFY